MLQQKQQNFSNKLMNLKILQFCTQADSAAKRFVCLDILCLQVT